MPKCPKCKTIISYLISITEETRRCIFYLVDGFSNTEDNETVSINGEEYFCPDCNFSICNNSEEAKKFLQRGHKR